MKAFVAPQLLLRLVSIPLQRPSVSSQRWRRRVTLARRPQASLATPPSADDLLEKLKSGIQPTQMLALIVLPQLPSAEAASLLHNSGVLDSPNRQVRLTAVATLGKLGAPREASVLLSVLRDDSDDYSVRAAAASALGSLLPGPSDGSGLVGQALSALVDVATADEHFILRYAAIVSMGNLGDRSAMETLLPIAKDVSAVPLEAAAAVRAIGEVVDGKDVEEEVMQAVVARAADKEDLVRVSVVRTLGRWKEAAGAGIVLENMRKDEERYGQSDLVRAVLNDELDDDVE